MYLHLAFGRKAEIKIDHQNNNLNDTPLPIIRSLFLVLCHPFKFFILDRLLLSSIEKDPV